MSDNGQVFRLEWTAQIKGFVNVQAASKEEAGKMALQLIGSGLSISANLHGGPVEIKANAELPKMDNIATPKLGLVVPKIRGG